MPLFGGRPDIEKMKSKQDVKGLSKALDHKEVEIRLGAVSALSEIGGRQAMEALATATQDSEAVVRETAAEALCAPVVYHLLSLLPPPPKGMKSFSFEEKRTIADVEEQLIRLGVPAVRPLIAALNPKNPTVLHRAINALGAIGDVRAVDPLFALYQQNKGNGIGGNAISALSHLKDLRITGLILSVLTSRTKDELNITRWYAANALGRIGDPSAIEPLLAILQDESENRNDAFYSVPGAAAAALGKLQDKRALNPLLKALKDEENEMRWSAAEALGDLGDPSAIASLLEMLQDENESSIARKYAAQALCKLRNQQGIDLMLANLRSDDSHMRTEAAIALCTAGNVQGMAGTISVLRDKNGWQRFNAIRALGKLGHPQALEALADALNDDEWEIREAAAKALNMAQGIDQQGPSLLASDPVCDICNEKGLGTFISSDQMRIAVQKGFDPFAAGRVPDVTSMFGVATGYEQWRNTIVQTSTGDWNVCSECMSVLKPYL